ncbi:hypothetical protein ACFY1S_19245 [Micromonospora sp. NPDC000663]|uniref:hypothetical protein n=1 Tax=Micromonospora sp. NPDC000663 TaxID=3364218 RepID=UPI0036B4F5D8
MTGAEPADSPSPDPARAADPTPTPDASPAAQAPMVAEAAPTEPAVAPVTPEAPGWAAPAPPTGSNHTAIVAAVVGGAVVLLLVACLGLVGGIFLLRDGDSTASDSETTAPVRPRSSGGGGPTASAAPTEEPVVQGPQASAYPAEKIEDLNRVCDEDIYYPELPKRAGKAPHPVVLLLSDTPGLRYKDDGYYYDLGLSKKVEQTWASEDPRTVQMVACLDRISAGSTIRTCKFDDPKPQTLTLVRTSWRLRVYEAATGRKLLEKTMPGDDQKCPYVVMVGADKKIYAEVSDRAAIAALRNLVTR